MKYYKSYMDRQEITPAVHEKLLDLEPPKKRSGLWLKYGALAACTALIVGVGVWRLAPRPQTATDPNQSANQFAAGYTPLPGEKDVVGPDDLFVVDSPVKEGNSNLFEVPAIAFPDATGESQVSADRAYAPGSFMVSLEKEDVQKLFWGPEGTPENTDHDLPWALFWDGYALHGRAVYSGEGQLLELTLWGEKLTSWGEKGRASFTLELRPGGLPFTCCIDLGREDTISDVFGVSVTGWSKTFGRDGDHYICGSEFMTKNDIGVRFTSQNNGRAEDGVDGEAWFNSLFVRQALISDGGLHLDHLMTNENIPAWREEEFSTLAQARQEADFAPYLPQSAPISDYGEFYGRLSFQDGVQNMLFVRWSRGYDDMEVCVYRDGYYPYHLVDPNEPEAYDLRLYSIPWCDSVPEEYRETVNAPAFKAEDMSLAVVEARGREHDTGGMTYSFDVLHPDGTLVSYHCDGMTAQQVWALVEETL